MSLIEIAQLLGNFGEVVGAFAVVATLVFIGIQVRQSSRTIEESNILARSAALDESLRLFSQFRRLIAGDSEVTKIWLLGRKGDDLDEIDYERFSALAREYHNLMRNAFVRHKTVNQDSTANNYADSWAKALKRYSGLRAIVEQPEFDESGFNELVFDALRELDREGRA
jgi:hypothetical protein